MSQEWTDNQVELLKRCIAVLEFLQNKPDDELCQAYMEHYDIKISGAKIMPREKLLRHAGTHISAAIRELKREIR